MAFVGLMKRKGKSFMRLPIWEVENFTVQLQFPIRTPTQRGIEKWL